MELQSKLLVGPKGGLYYIIDGKKKYVKKTEFQKKDISMDSVKSNKRNSSTKRNNNNDKILTKVRYCCCCGKELKRDECNYYDLTDYCPRCALADGIITSLE